MAALVAYVVLFFAPLVGIEPAMWDDVASARFLYPKPIPFAAFLVGGVVEVVFLRRVLGRARPRSWRPVLAALGLALAWSSPANAATRSPAFYTLAGLNSSSLYAGTGALEALDASRNPVVGLLTQWPSRPGPSPEVGLLIERRGASWFSRYAPVSGTTRESGYVLRLETAYASAPVRLRETLSLGRVNVSAFGGVELGYLLWARQTTKDRDTHATVAVDGDVRDELRKWELAASVGGRIGTTWGEREAFLDVSFVRGVWPRGGMSVAWVGAMPHVNNRVLRLCVGIVL